MTEKELKKIIAQKLTQGNTKTEIYHELKDANQDDSIRKILAARPPINLSPKIKLLQKTLVMVWIIFWLIEFIGAIDSVINFDIKYLISFAISTYVTVQIWKFHGDFYLPAIFWFVWTIFNTLKQLSGSNELYFIDNFMIVISVLYLILIISGIILMLIIRKNVFGYYNWF